MHTQDNNSSSSSTSNNNNNSKTRIKKEEPERTKHNIVDACRLQQYNQGAHTQTHGVQWLQWIRVPSWLRRLASLVCLLGALLVGGGVVCCRLFCVCVCVCEAGRGCICLLVVNARRPSSAVSLVTKQQTRPDAALIMRASERAVVPRG